jgi:hypothetical protein
MRSSNGGNCKGAGEGRSAQNSETSAKKTDAETLKGELNPTKKAAFISEGRFAFARTDFICWVSRAV